MRSYIHKLDIPENINQDFFSNIQLYKDNITREENLNIKNNQALLFSDFDLEVIEDYNFKNILGLDINFNQDNLLMINEQLKINIVDYERLQPFFSDINDFFNKKIPYLKIENIPYRRNGELIFFNLKFNSIKEEHFVVTLDDITEITYDKLIAQRLANDNKILLKEVHHRVKNNLQILLSLISLQERFNKDCPTIIEYLKLSISSMAIIHNQLYEDNFNFISTKNLANDMKNIFENIYGIQGIKFDILCVDDMKLNVDKTHPLLLSINELVINSINYAFDKDDDKLIRCIFKNENNNLIIIYEDSGKVKRNESSHGGLGNMIIDSLIGQIDGKKEYMSDDYSLKISIPLN